MAALHPYLKSVQQRASLPFGCLISTLSLSAAVAPVAIAMRAIPPCFTQLRYPTRLASYWPMLCFCSIPFLSQLTAMPVSATRSCSKHSCNKQVPRCIPPCFPWSRDLPGCTRPSTTGIMRTRPLHSTTLSLNPRQRNEVKCTDTRLHMIRDATRLLMMQEMPYPGMLMESYTVHQYVAASACMKHAGLVPRNAQVLLPTVR